MPVNDHGAVWHCIRRLLNFLYEASVLFFVVVAAITFVLVARSHLLPDPFAVANSVKFAIVQCAFKSDQVSDLKHKNY